MSARRCTSQSLATMPPSTRSGVARAIGEPRPRHRRRASRASESRRLQRRARQLRASRRASGRRSRRAPRVPLRRAQAGEGRHEIDRLRPSAAAASASVSAAGAMMPKAVAQPLHRRAGDEDRALQRVGALAAHCQATVVSRRCLSAGVCADVEQQEAAGAVGALICPARNRPGRTAPPAGRRRCRRWECAPSSPGDAVAEVAGAVA